VSQGQSQCQGLPVDLIIYLVALGHKNGDTASGFPVDTNTACVNQVLPSGATNFALTCVLKHK